MNRSSRIAVTAALGLALVSSTAAARSLVDRLPSGAALLGSLDLDLIRKSPLMGKHGLDGPLPEQASGVEAILRSAGIDARRDVEEVAFAVMPQRDGGADGDFAMIASGRLDPIRLRAAAVAHGGAETKLGGVQAIRLADGGEGGSPAFLSFMEGLTVLGGAEATKLVHERGRSGASAVPRMPAEIPRDAAFWVAADLGQMGSGGALSSSVPMMGQVQRIQLWARLAEAVELNAIADAPDAAVATQIAGMAQLAAGFMALQGDSPRASVLSSLSVVARDRRVTASLKLTKDQLDAMRTADGGAPSPPAVAPKPATSKPAAGASSAPKAAP